MESQNGGGVSESEFMDGFKDGQERGGEHDHFGIVDGTEDFLELGGRSK